MKLLPILSLKTQFSAILAGFSSDKTAHKWMKKYINQDIFMSKAIESRIEYNWIQLYSTGFKFEILTNLSFVSMIKSEFD